MRQILTTLSMKTYVGNGPKKTVLRLYLAREQVCPDILEQTKKDANFLKNMLACDKILFFSTTRKKSVSPCNVKCLQTK
jgi:hypothetical protein